MNEAVRSTVRLPRAARRDALIAAARRSFVEHGFEGTSLDAIIAEVGGSRRNIYAEFGGKEGLLRAVVERIISEIAEGAARPAEAADDPRDWLLQVGTAFVREMLAPEVIAVFRQLIASGGAGRTEAEALWRAGPERFRGMLSDWLAVQHAAGRLHVPDQDLAAMLLPEMLRASYQIEILVGRRGDVPDAEVAGHVERVVDFFLAAAAPRGRAGP